MGVGDTGNRYDCQRRELDEEQAEMHRITMLQMRRERASLEKPYREARLTGTGIVIGALAATIGILACAGTTRILNVLDPSHAPAAACIGVAARNDDRPDAQ